MPPNARLLTVFILCHRCTQEKLDVPWSSLQFLDGGKTPQKTALTVVDQSLTTVPSLPSLPLFRERATN